MHDLGREIDDGFIGFPGGAKRTILAAYVELQDVVAWSPENLIERQSKCLESGGIHGRDSPLFVDRVDAVGRALEDPAGQFSPGRIDVLSRCFLGHATALRGFPAFRAR